MWIVVTLDGTIKMDKRHEVDEMASFPSPPQQHSVAALRDICLGLCYTQNAISIVKNPSHPNIRRRKVVNARLL